MADRARTDEATLAETVARAGEAETGVAAGPVEIHINGEPRDIAAGQSLAELLRAMGVDPDPESGNRGIAVALDGRVVSRRAWASTTLEGGCRVEVIGAIGGG